VPVRLAVRSALALLSPRDRRLLGLSVGMQMGTAFLDLFGVLLIGLVGALAVTTVQSQPPPEVVSSIATALGLSDLSVQSLVLVLSAAAAGVLLTKSVVSSWLTRRVLIFLANRQALVSARLSRELLSRPLSFVQQRSSQETAFALITGAGAATSQVLGQVVIIVTEAALLVVLAVALLFISPWVALGAIVFFALVGLGLQRAMGSWASRVGQAVAAADIASWNSIQEALAAYREIAVTDRRALYVARIQEHRWQAAKVAADLQFMSMFPKYMFEAALVLGGFALAGFLFATQDSVAAVGTLALFLAAGSRVMPSLLRLQGAALGLRSAAGTAEPTFRMAEELGHPMEVSPDVAQPEELRRRALEGSPGFVPSISIKDVSVTYPESGSPAVAGVTLEVPAGSSLALVGRSGAGKSTLADVILGVLTPSSGSVSVGGMSPWDCAATWPGGIGYVPQTVVVTNDSVRSNVALGIPKEGVVDDLVWQALERAHLAAEFRGHPDGLGTQVGENGLRLSGGQKQRLGLARALYSQPRLLVLDEATSALDAETEELITQTLSEARGHLTTVIIAHRLSTVRSVDQLVYLDGGVVKAIGDFEQVARRVPSFLRQAHLMGLADHELVHE
jgi:ABC-type multidrug transport system fused ATPase/permease subunit